MKRMSMKGTNRPARAIAVASALALVLAAPVSAFAADPAAPTTPKDMTGTAPSQASTITGTIHATTLKVSVPTVVAFNIDPGAAKGTTGTGQKRGQFTSPANYTVTNYSAVDVYAFVSGVTSPDATLVNAEASLKKTPGLLNTANVSVMVGLGDKDAEMALSDQADWLTTSVGDTKTTRYYALKKADKGKLAASTDAASNAAGESATMKIYGAVKSGGWAENNSFKVVPTFKIMTTDPSVA